METVIIVYCIACYLYTLGLIIGGLKDRDFDISMAFGMLLHFVTAPVVTPIVMGYIRYTEQNYF